MNLEELTFLTSDYTTKLQSSRQHGSGTKTDMSLGQNSESRNKATHLQSITQGSCVTDMTMTRKAGTHDGEKTGSSTSDIGKAGQLSELMKLEYSHYIQK